MNTAIDMKELKKYRDELFKKMNEYNGFITKEEENAYKLMFDRLFTIGQFAGVNIVLNNKKFQKKNGDKNDI